MKRNCQRSKNASASDLLLKISLSKPIVPKDVSLIYLKHRRKLQMHKARVPISYIKEYLTQNAFTHVRVKTEFDLLYNFPQRKIEKMRETKRSPITERASSTDFLFSTEMRDKPISRTLSRNLRRRVQSRQEDLYKANEFILTANHCQKTQNKLQISHKLLSHELRNSTRANSIHDIQKRIYKEKLYRKSKTAEIKHFRGKSATPMKSGGSRRDLDILL